MPYLMKNALVDIAHIPGCSGNDPGSFAKAREFETECCRIFRKINNVRVVDRPNGANSPPAFTVNGWPFMVKSSKGLRPMWNEAILPPQGTFIFNGSFGTVVVDNDILLTEDDYANLETIRKAAPAMVRRHWPTTMGRFRVTGGRVQFGDTISWVDERRNFLDLTLNAHRVHWRTRHGIPFE